MNDTILRFIAAYQTAHGRPPTIREIAAHLGRAYSNANYHITQLVQDGTLTKERPGPLAYAHTGPARTLRLTPAGLAAIGVVPPPATWPLRPCVQRVERIGTSVIFDIAASGAAVVQ